MLELSFPARVLAVVGAVALGSLFLGWMVQVAAALMFGQKVPRWPLWGVRGLGGVVAGWLATLALFGPGGGGMGGDGGFGLGTTKQGKEQASTATKKEEKKEKTDVDPPSVEGDTLRVEVLGDAPLKAIAKAANFDVARRYRLVGERELRTLDDVKDLIRKRDESLARLEIIVYKDSPAQDNLYVADLEKYAKDRSGNGKGRLKVDFSAPDRYAPLE